jgi:hypothetical protein
MEEDRMMILKMLQEGKIDAEQAAKLLEALESGKSFEKKKGKKKNQKPDGGFVSASPMP